MGFTQIEKDIYLLRLPFGGTTTGVILLCGTQNILIDAGGSAALVDEEILPALAERGLTPADISVLTCTHTHGDHIGGFARLREAGVRKIAVYARSADKVRDPLHYNIEIRKAFPESSPPPSAGLVGTNVDEILSDGDLVGGRLRLVATPGHDDDAVCFFDEVTKTLICGDSVQHNGTLVQGCGAYMSLPDYRASMQRLLALDAVTVILGHPFLPHGDVVRGREQVRAFFAEALDLTRRYGDFVRKMRQAGVSDIAEIAKALVDDVGGVQPKHLFLPMYTVREHLKEIQ